MNCEVLVLNKLRNPFYLMAGIYLLVDAIALASQALATMGIMPFIPDLDWLRIHLLTIGVVVQAILGTLPRLTAVKLGKKEPGAALTWILWLLVNISFGILLYSMPGNLPLPAAWAAAGIFVAIVLLLVILYRQGVCSPVGARAGLRFYFAGPLFFLVGILMALSMLLQWPAPGQFFGQLEAHVHANVWGFLALIVAGFLLDHIPAYTGHPLRWPQLVPATSWLLISGASGLVAGPWLALLPLTILGIAIYVVGTVLLLANLAGTMLAAHSWTPNLVHILVAYLWMVVPAFVAPTILALTGHLPIGSVETSAVSGLVAGWILQIVIAAFPLRLREVQPHNAGRDGWWFSVVTLNLGVLALWLEAATSNPTLPTALGYTLIVLGFLPPLLTILRRVFARRAATPFA